MGATRPQCRLRRCARGDSRSPSATRAHLQLRRCVSRTGWNGAYSTSRFARLSRNSVALGSKAHTARGEKKNGPTRGPFCFLAKRASARIVSSNIRGSLISQMKSIACKLSSSSVVHSHTPESHEKCGTKCGTENACLESHEDATLTPAGPDPPLPQGETLSLTYHPVPDIA